MEGRLDIDAIKARAQAGPRSQDEIARMVDDIRELIAEVERLRADVASLLREPAPPGLAGVKRRWDAEGRRYIELTGEEEV